MKKFTKNLAYFILPLLLISYPLDILFSNILKENNKFPGEYEVWNDIYESKINCDIAIYGSSRAWVQIDSEIIENTLQKKTYNFGMDGHNFWLQYLRHLEYIKHNKKPNHILLNVDIFTLEKRAELYQQEQFLPYMLWNKNIHSYTNTYKGFNTSDYYIPFLRYIGKNRVIKNIATQLIGKKGDTAKYRNKGYKGFDKKWDKNVDSILTSKQKYKIKFHLETLNLFEQFLKECIKDNIIVTLVYAPEYIDGQNYTINREEAITYYKKISKKYKVTFLNYSKDNISLRKNLFYNASHLNKIGSKLFSRKLALDLKIENTN
ncbi:MAG: hypothetical protein AB8B78_07915 [Polaribacter sp.]